MSGSFSTNCSDFESAKGVQYDSVYVKSHSDSPDKPTETPSTEEINLATRKWMPKVIVRENLPRQDESIETELDSFNVEDDELYGYRQQCSEDKASKAFVYFKESDIDGAVRDDAFIAQAGFGKVYRAEIDGRDVAVKVPVEKSTDKEKKAFEKEVEILRTLRHPYIVILHGACLEKLALVYEFLPNGTLEGRLRGESRHSFTWRDRMKVAANISTALAYLHRTRPHQIAHGDVKPDNILLDADNVCKLGDFGISRFMTDKTATGTACHLTGEPKGSGPYMDPCFNRKFRQLTRLADVYAFGIILLELVSSETASRIRYIVIQKMEKLKACSEVMKLKSIRKLGLITDIWNLDEKSREVALKMLELGLRCSEENRKDRPQMREVALEINSINCEVVSSIDPYQITLT